MQTKIMVQNLVILVCITFAVVIDGSILKTEKRGTCSVIIDGTEKQMAIGESWNNSTEPCVRLICQASDLGETKVNTFREYCYLNCHNEFELVIPDGQCCGECVQTKCKADTGTVHDVGEMWRSEDTCTFYECVRQSDEQPMVASYQKSCPPIGNCPNGRLKFENCCSVCDQTIGSRLNSNATNQHFVYQEEQHNEIMDINTYLNHPCARECVVGEAPMICNYTFVIEWYETLSKACYDCPFNETDCYRPHCVFGDGMRRSIVTINRMMPGPRLQVCLGDLLRVDVNNQLMGDSTTVHWHGMHQTDTPFMDGVPMITQCPIPPHTTFRYSFTADHEGTHWWHSHSGMQRSDGALGALIVRKPREQMPPVVSTLYEYDLPAHTIIIQDWEHISAVATFSSFHHSIGDNKPKNILINARGKYVEPTLLTDEVALRKTVANKHGAEGTTEFLANDVDIITFNPDELHAAAHPTDTVAESESLEDAALFPNATEKRYFVDLHTSRIRRAADSAPLLTPLEIFHITAGGSFRFRTINAGFLNCPVEISIDEHNITVISSDGGYFEPVVVSTLVSYAGERFDFVLKADQPVANYWVRVRGLMDCDERFTKAHQVAILRYAGAPDGEPTGEDKPTYDYKRTGLQMNALNQGTGLVESVSIAELTTLEPDDDPRLLQEFADFKFYVYYDFYDSDNPHFNVPTIYSNAHMTDVSKQFIGPQLNRISMKMPSSPLLSARDTLDESKFCNESSLAHRNIDCTVEFCECSHVLQVPLNATVEMVLVDEGFRYDANHPFHLHGHAFKVVAMERLKPTGLEVEEVQALDNAGLIKRRLRGAPTKDTITVPDGGYTIIRFVANNPGYWLFHCHIEYHVEVGMALVFKVGNHDQMRPVPKDFPTCSNYMPRMVGADDDANDDSGAGNHSPKRLSALVLCLWAVFWRVTT